MAPPPGRLGGTVKLPVQVRMFPEEIAAVDACAAALSQQSYGAAFSRAEALRIAAMEWLKERQERQAHGTPAPSQRAPATAPALEAEAAPAAPAPGPGGRREHGDAGDKQRTAIEGPASFPRRSNPEQPRHGGVPPPGGEREGQRGANSTL